jgi:protein-tyrosine phosphatase
MKKSILFVCLGNICRSPAADGILRSIKNDFEFVGNVDSCGTAAYHSGEKPDPRMRAVARRKGVDLDFLTARQISPLDFDSFDYIVAMDSENLSNIQKIMPSQSKSKLRLLLGKSFETLNVPDPYYGGEQGFINCFELIERGVKVLLEEIKEEVL